MTDLQLPLPLPMRTAMGRNDFLVAPSNAMAMAFIDIWPNWPNKRLAVVGPASAGKSHLSAVWAAASCARVVQASMLRAEDVPDLARGCVAVEDAHGPLSMVAEEALFHLHNLVAAEGHGLLVTGRGTPSTWPIKLPDLASRLQAITLAEVQGPDDQLLAALLVKHFADRQIRIAPNVITYVVPRIERSFAAVEALARRLDAAALEAQKPITRALARAVLDSDDAGA
jgi:chromosomal replication initiation ATPase DnaA